MRLDKFIKENKKYFGYKIVHGLITDRYAKSIYDGSIIPLYKSWQNFPKNGLFLGTTKDFCLDYYSVKGEEGAESEMLLTYEYDNNDVIKGYPEDKNSEVQVSRARLVKKEVV